MNSLILLGVLSLLTTRITGQHIISINLDTIALDTDGLKENVHSRMAAQNDETVLLRESDSITISFCLTEPETFLVKKIVYSTDGQSDDVSIFLDNELIGRFMTHNFSNYGMLWDEFHKTGAVGLRFDLPAGQHDFKIDLVSADQWGVEFDCVDFEFGKSSTARQVLCPKYVKTIAASETTGRTKRDVPNDAVRAKRETRFNSNGGYIAAAIRAKREILAARNKRVSSTS